MKYDNYHYLVNMHTCVTIECFSCKAIWKSNIDSKSIVNETVYCSFCGCGGKVLHKASEKDMTK